MYHSKDFVGSPRERSGDAGVSAHVANRFRALLNLGLSWTVSQLWSRALSALVEIELGQPGNAGHEMKMPDGK